jgi:hypothetical protein
MKLTSKALKELIMEELEEIKFARSKPKGPGSHNPDRFATKVGYEELVSAVQDILYREPPKGEEPMDLDEGGVVKNPNRLAGAIGFKIFSMLYPPKSE